METKRYLLLNTQGRRKFRRTEFLPSEYKTLSSKALRAGPLYTNHPPASPQYFHSVAWSLINTRREAVSKYQGILVQSCVRPRDFMPQKMPSPGDAVKNALMSVPLNIFRYCLAEMGKFSIEEENWS